jgi:transposase InsO family protein
LRELITKNGIFRTEFYDNPNNLLEDSIVGIRRELLKSIDKYNTYGPHQGLKGATPMGYINGVQETSFFSHNM